MTNSNAYIINKKQVILSAFFVPLAIPFFTIFLFIMDGANQLDNGFGGFVSFTIMGLIWGAIIWVPTILLCMLLEYLVLNNSSTKNVVFGLLAFEAIAAWLAINGVFGFDETGSPSYPLAISILLTQGVRLLYLSIKKRMYTNTQTENDDEMIIDDTEIFK